MKSTIEFIIIILWGLAVAIIGVGAALIIDPECRDCAQLTEEI